MPRLFLLFLRVEKNQGWAAKSICMWYSPAFRTGCEKVSHQNIPFQVAALVAAQGLEGKCA
jgi:hypothetical protein